MSGPTPTPPAERFWSKTREGTAPAARPELGPCLIWTGAVAGNGYGNFWMGGGAYVGSHRAVFAILGEEIPAGLEPDHLCRVPLCVRRSHLELVSRSVNLRRGVGPSISGARVKARAARRTSCKNGHPFDEANTYLRPSGPFAGTRDCRRCRADAEARRRRRVAA